MVRLITSFKGKVKVACPCGAQLPPFASGEAYTEWRTTPEGRAWENEHRRHLRSHQVEVGGRTESLDEALARKAKSRSEAAPEEVIDPSDLDWENAVVVEPRREEEDGVQADQE